MPTLAQSNKYLATPALRKKAVRLTIATSSAIEGIYAPFKPVKLVRSSVKADGRPGTASVKAVVVKEGKKQVVKRSRRAKSA